MFGRHLGMTIGFRGRIPFLEGECVRALGELDFYGVGGAFASVIFCKFCTEPASLNTNHRIHCWIEIRWTAELFGSNLVFLKGNAGMFDGVVCQITQKLT